MKFTAVIVSALATLAAAAPTEKTERSVADLSLLNGLNGFQQVNLNYLLGINSGALDLQLLQLLGQQNNLNLLQFQGLFQSNVFDINAVLQLQQLQDLLLFGQLGVLNGFDLASLQFQQLNFGLLNNIQGFDLASLIQPQVVTQVQTIASQVFVAKE